MTATGEVNHPGPQEVAAFIDGGLDGAARQRIVAHLADCEICRDEIASVRRSLARDGRVWLRRRAWLVAAAAAVAGILFLGPLLDFGVTNETPVYRAEGTSQPTSIVVVEPPDTVLHGRSPRFVWRSVGADATYTLQLLGHDGSVRSWQTRDTSTALPDGAILSVGLYHWNVNALRADGMTFESRSRPLTVVPR